MMNFEAVKGEKPRLVSLSIYSIRDYPRAPALELILCNALDLNLVASLQSKVSNRWLNLMAAPFLLFLGWRKKPDVILLPFRNLTLLILLKLFFRSVPVIYDELVNPIHWFFIENGKSTRLNFIQSCASRIYAWALSRANVIITDSAESAEKSSTITNISQKKFLLVPPTNLFPPLGERQFPEMSNSQTTFLFYGQGLRLHGVDVVLEAFRGLADNNSIHLVLLGLSQSFRERHADEIELLRQEGITVVVRPRVPFRELAEEIGRAHVGLAGPFGNTNQARMVTTTKTLDFLANGIPAIVGDNHPNEQFEDLKDVLKVEIGSATSLRERVRWCTANRGLLSEIGHQGHKTYLERLSPGAIAAALKEETLVREFSATLRNSRSGR